MKCLAKKTFWVSEIWTWTTGWVTSTLAMIYLEPDLVGWWFLYLYFGFGAQQLMDWLYSKSVQRLGLTAFVVQNEKTKQNNFWLCSDEKFPQNLKKFAAHPLKTKYWHFVCSFSLYFAHFRSLVLKQTMVVYDLTFGHNINEIFVLQSLSFQICPRAMYCTSKSAWEWITARIFQQSCHWKSSRRWPGFVLERKELWYDLFQGKW